MGSRGAAGRAMAAARAEVPVINLEESSLGDCGHYFTEDNRKKPLLKAGGRQEKKKKKKNSRGLIESQSLALTVSGHVSPGTKLAAPGPVNSLVMEFPRKRKGSDSELAQCSPPRPGYEVMELKPRASSLLGKHGTDRATAPGRQDRLEQGSKHSQDPPSNPDEQEVTLVCEDPQDSLSPFSEKSTPAPTPESSILKLSSWNAKMGLQMKELGADHVDWLEKINSIIQKINNTESTVKSLLTEVISLENQSEHLEDPDQETNVEVDACNEACELKEKLIERIESFYKEMNVLNTKLEMYHTQGRETDSHSSEDSDAEQTEPLLPEASPTPSGSHTPPYLLPVWKHALKLFLMVYVITITGLSCYTLFVDATFLFERVLPSVLGRRTMWELREMMAPFLNLEAEDLLPS